MSTPTQVQIASAVREVPDLRDVLAWAAEHPAGILSGIRDAGLWSHLAACACSWDTTADRARWDAWARLNARLDGAFYGAIAVLDARDRA